MKAGALGALCLPFFLAQAAFAQQPAPAPPQGAVGPSARWPPGPASAEAAGTPHAPAGYDSGAAQPLQWERRPAGPGLLPYGVAPTDEPRACSDPRDLRAGDGAAGALPALPPCRRGVGEMVELYIYAGAFGFGSGLLAMQALGVDDSSARFAASALGVGAALLGVYGLDRISDLYPGMPMAVSSGVLLGYFEGMLAYGAFTGEPFGEGSAPTIWGGTALGAGLGVLSAYVLRPTPGQASLVRSGGMWGAWIAAMWTLISKEDDATDVLRTIFTGYNAGLVGAAILTSVVSLSRLRVLYLDAGGFLGALAGGVLLTPAGSPDGRTTGLALGIGSLVGMALSYVLTVPHEAEPVAGQAAGARAGSSPLEDLRFFAAPAAGGALFSATTRF